MYVGILFPGSEMDDTTTSSARTVSAFALPDYFADHTGRLSGLLEKTLEIGQWRLSGVPPTLHLSQKSLELLGMPPQEPLVELRAVLGRFEHEERRKLAGLIQDTIATGRTFETVLPRVAGAETMQLHITGIVDAGGDERGYGVIGCIRDISAQIEAEELAQSRARLFSTLMHHVPCAIAVFDKHMRYVAVSHYWAIGHGHKHAQDLIGQQHYEMFPKALEFIEEHKQVLAGKTLEKRRNLMSDAQGNPIDQICIMSPWYARKGEIGGMVLMLENIDNARPGGWGEPVSEDTGLLDLADGFSDKN